MKEYLNDVTHQMMEPEVAILRFHKEVLSHFGSVINPNNSMMKTITQRNEEVPNAFINPLIQLDRIRITGKTCCIKRNKNCPRENRFVIVLLHSAYGVR